MFCVRTVPGTVCAWKATEAWPSLVWAGVPGSSVCRPRAGPEHVPGWGWGQLALGCRVSVTGRTFIK